MITLYYKFRSFALLLCTVFVVLIICAIQLVRVPSVLANDNPEPIPSDAFDKVSISKLDDVNMISEIGSIPLTIFNELDHDITLTLDARSDDWNRLEVWGLGTITIKGNSEQKVGLPIDAKANGTSTITTHLYSENHDFGEMSFNVHVTRAIGTIVSTFFYTLIGLLVIFGVIRTVRHHRRRVSRS